MKKITPLISKGFTLIELMIVVAIIGILAAIAYPSYVDSVRKSRRSDALAALGGIQMEQEKWRANDTDYGTATEILGAAAADSPDGYYSITIAQTITTQTDPCAIDANAPSGSAYAIKATGQNGQDQDAGCTAICVDQEGIYYPTDCIRK